MLFIDVTKSLFTWFFPWFNLLRIIQMWYNVNFINKNFIDRKLYKYDNYTSSKNIYEMVYEANQISEEYIEWNMS